MLNWDASVDFLSLFDPARRERVMIGSRRIILPAGAVTEYPEPEGRADVIERGLVRAFQRSEDGRTATLGYLRQGEYVGWLPPAAPRPVVYIQALQETTFRHLDAENLRRLYATDPEISGAIAAHEAVILSRIVRVVTVRTLGSLRQRVAFDLLERASTEQLRSGRLALTVTHEEIAEGLGSAREVVSRVVGQLRRDGAVATSQRHIRILDAERLVAMVQGLLS